MDKSVTWNKTEAQKKFIELLEAVNQNPQLITDEQGKVIAAVIEIEAFRELMNWNQLEKQSSLAESFTELHQICAEEDYTLEIPSRIDRNHLFRNSSKETLAYIAPQPPNLGEQELKVSQN